MKRTKKRIVLSIVAVVMVIAILCLTVYFKSVSDYKQAVSDITFQNIDMTKMADGTYVGECNVNFIYAKVELTVQEEPITTVKLVVVGPYFI